jgi:hypothetical protein
MIEISKPEQITDEKALSRRKALVKLGLAAGVTSYIAPLMTNLSQASADAGCPPGYHRSMGTCVR